MADSGKSKSRLMISNMVLENFKSYAGIQEIGPFHKCFSSIVGPNGSGKSNVIDALLFVFGKRAKQLRLNKVSELIHKSKNFPNLEYARVSVYFQLIEDHDTPDTFDIIPGSEFVVSRIAYTNNSSKYTVNDKASTYTDVGLLLRSHGIDLDNNRFLILQGEVEQIAMMKPKALTPHEEGLLEYLEDIIGSNRYVTQIDQAYKDLETLNEQRTEKVNRLKVAEKERDNLSGSKAEAEIFLDKEKEIRKKKNILYQILIGNETVHHTEVKSKVENGNEKLSAAKLKLKESERNFITMEKSYETTRQDYIMIETELQKSTQEFGAFERRDIKLQEDMVYTKTQIKKIQTNITKELKKEEECEKEANTLLVEVEAKRKICDDIKVKKDIEESQLQEVMDGLHAATQELRDQLEIAQTALGDAERSVSGLSTEKETIEMGQKLIYNRIETVLKNIQVNDEKLVALDIEKTNMSTKKTEITTEKSALNKQIPMIQSAINRYIEEEKDVETKLKDAITTAEDTRTQYTAQQSQGSRSTIITAILKASKKNGPLASAGVIGRLGDLATIDSKYDVAVSTACSMLDHIVCETLDGCQLCVQYLRQHNLGRASFIALSQMDQYKSRMNQSIHTPNNTPRLFDLITVKKNEYLPAFYMALRDTLVTPDLDEAVRIAYEGDRAKWRVVTQDGNLIDTSGSMSGGGKDVRSGAMSLSTGSSTTAAGGSTKHNTSVEEEITLEQLQVLDQKVTEYQSKLSIIRENKMKAENELKEIDKRLRVIDAEMEKIQFSLQHHDEQKALVQERLNTLRGETELTSVEKRELKTLQEKLSKIDDEINESSPQLGTLRANVSSLQRRILEVGGPKLSRAQAKVDILTKQYDSANAGLSTKEVEEANLRKQATKASINRKKNEEELSKCTEKLEALQKEQEEMENDAAKVNDAIEQAKDRMTEQETLLKNITEEFNTLKASVETIKTNEVDLMEEIKLATKALKESTHKLDQHRRHLDQLKSLHKTEQIEFHKAISDVLKTKKAPQVPVSTSAESNIGSNGSIDVMVVADNVTETETSLVLDELIVLNNEELDTYLSKAKTYIDDYSGQINVLEEERDKMKGSINMNALLDYLRKDATYREKLNELEVITEERNKIRKGYENLRRLRLEEFMNGFGIITLKLKEMYQMITLGGDAELELVDSLDPFSEGIVFSVRPPKKSWKNISNLSGGEKTLSSLALVFALHHFKPTPLYVMDEIDAALDFKNVSIVANYIKERTKNAQFIIISLRNNMFELADRLVGIYKTHDATKSVTINPKLFATQTVTSSSENYVKPSSDIGITTSTSGSSKGGRENNTPTITDNKNGERSSTTASGVSQQQQEPPYKHGRRTVLADTTNLI